MLFGAYARSNQSRKREMTRISATQNAWRSTLPYVVAVMKMMEQNDVQCCSSSRRVDHLASQHCFIRRRRITRSTFVPCCQQSFPGKLGDTARGSAAAAAAAAAVR